MSRNAQSSLVQNHLVKLWKATKDDRKASVTARQIDLNSVQALRAEAQKLIRRVGTVQTGQRGRPAIQWRLTDKGRKRVQRSVA